MVRGQAGCVGWSEDPDMPQHLPPEPVQETVGEGKPCYGFPSPVRLGDFHTTENRGELSCFQSDSGNHFHSTFVNRVSVWKFGR